MSLNVDLTGLGAWELTYYQKLTGNSQNLRPLIDPLELPYLTESRIFLVSTFSTKSKPTWYRAGWLYRQVEGVNIDDTVVFEGLTQTPTTSIDYGQKLIGLNLSQLVIFPQISGNHRLRFEAVPWLSEVTLGIWEYKGVESDSTEDLINAVRAKLETIEFKIDQL